MGLTFQRIGNLCHDVLVVFVDGTWVLLLEKVSLHGGDDGGTGSGAHSVLNAQRICDDFSDHIWKTKGFLNISGP